MGPDLSTVGAADHAMGLVAERLEALGDAHWTGTIIVDPSTMALGTGVLAPDLYEGLSGLAVSFAAIADVTGSTRYERLAHEAVHRLRAQLEDGALRRCDLGLEGLGGIAWASYRTWSTVGGDDAIACLKQTCEALVAAVSKRERVVHVDLIGGEAGALAALLTLLEADVVAGDILATTARHLVDLLLAASVDVPEGRVWPTVEGEHIVGLGHGTSGILDALHRASSTLGHRIDEISAVVEATLAFEDAAFDRAVGNWHDPRRVGDPAPWSCWCYGAAGTRFVRHRIGRPVPHACVDPLATDDPAVDHVCCGRAGRLLMAQASGHPGSDAVAEALANRLLEDASAIAGTSPDRAPDLDVLRRSTSLFLGLPGIAYALVQEPTATAADVLTLS